MKEIDTVYQDLRQNVIVKCFFEVFLFKKVSSELQVREQSIVTHDVVNGKISILGNFKHGQPFGSFPMLENQYIKAKGWIDFFQYDYLQGHNV